MTPPLELRIHAPQFYRQMVTYTTLAGFLSYTLLDPYEENHTAWSNDPMGLIAMFEEFESIKAVEQNSRHDEQHRPGLFLKILWAAYARLRCVGRPLRGTYPDYGFPQARAASSPSPPTTLERRVSRHRPEEYLLDEFVRFHCSPWVQMHFVFASLGFVCRSRIMNTIGGE